ncbi:MAG: Nif3-like dinuclear metal center hexameric protein [Ignavibacteriae bacterium]|nr:Nif3-like dinuclear metal center hexameric protein [Ignavibacteriota bacterium]
MTIADIEHIIEAWAPKWIAWEKDNVGLQLGDRSRHVSKILVALDVTEKIVTEAIAQRAELIVSHHPLLFRPLKAVTTTDETGKLVLKLAKSNIAVYSAHTNLDFTKHGVSFAFAEKFGLTNIRFLSPLKGLSSKIVVFVPQEHVERVADAMSDAGAGVIGEYSSCSYRISGTGTFRGSASTNPFIGTANKLETVEEVRLEMIAPRGAVNTIVSAMKTAHPYEEIAYDVYPLENDSTNYGMGAIGDLPNSMPLKSFLQLVKKSLKAEAVRYTAGAKQRVQKIAVCGGSGSDLLQTAVRANADAFVTADVKYHTYHSAEGTIALVDAGHWETEQVILEPLAKRLREAARHSKEQLTVRVTKFSTNPTHYSY